MDDGSRTEHNAPSSIEVTGDRIASLEALVASLHKWIEDDQAQLAIETDESERSVLENGLNSFTSRLESAERELQKVKLKQEGYTPDMIAEVMSQNKEAEVSSE